MDEVPASEARANWRRTVDAAKRAPLAVTDYGRESVVILGFETARRALDALAREQAADERAETEEAATPDRMAVGVSTVRERVVVDDIDNSAFVSGAVVTRALHDLGADAQWAAELAEARSAVVVTDPWSDDEQ